MQAASLRMQSHIRRQTFSPQGANLFQPSFKLREKTRIGAKATKRWHAPATPADRALATGLLDAASAARIIDLRARSDPVVALTAIRTA